MSLSDKLRGVLEEAGLSESVGSPRTREPGEPSYVSGRGVDRDRPPRDEYETYRDQYRSVPLVRAALDVRASAVTRPGYRITADSDTTEEALRDWAEEMTIYAAEFNQDFSAALWQIARDLDLNGTVLIEHVYDDPEEKNVFTSVKLFDPATARLLTYPGTSILIRPSDQDIQKKAPQTPAKENAAYLQYPEGEGFGRDEVYLSQNDVTKIARNPGFESAGPFQTAEDDPKGEGRGISLVESVAEEVERYRARKEDYNASIASQAYPRMFVEFSDFELPGGDVVHWDDNSIDGFMDELERDISSKRYNHTEQITRDTGDIPASSWRDPGGTFGSPPGVDASVHEGSVPDIADSLSHSVDSILAGLQVPKYTIGFAEDLNRRVSDDQQTNFNMDVSARQRQLERRITPIFQKKAEWLSENDDSNVEDTDGVQFQIATPPSENPLEDEDFDADEFSKVMNAVATFFDSKAGQSLDQEEFVGDMMGMDLGEYVEEGEQRGVSVPDQIKDQAQSPPQQDTMDQSNIPTEETDEGGDGDSDDDTDQSDGPSSPSDASETEASAEDKAILLSENENLGVLAQYGAGDIVTTTDGKGLVIEVMTQSFENEGTEYDASSDSPVYIVALADKQTYDMYRGDDLESDELNVDVDDPVGDLKNSGEGEGEGEGEGAENAAASLLIGASERQRAELNFEYPPSWKKSEIPARVILLDAFSSMGGSFTGCSREMSDEVSDTDEFCAAMKDRALGYEGWRGGWADSD